MTEQPIESKKEQRRAWVWIMLMVNIVFILLLLTLSVIALRVGNVLPEDTDILFIVGKKPQVTVGDKEKWQAGKEVDIFSASYENGEGVVTVMSDNGDSLIAPGTVSTYEFSMYNNGNMAVFYETAVTFSLTIGDELQDYYAFPLSVRLRTESDDYLIGARDKWINVNQATGVNYVRVLGAYSYETFTLELKWEFEGGNDELDTMFGNQAVKDGISLKFGINTYAEEHIDPTAKGGTIIEGKENAELGGTVRWLWVILLILNASILIFYVSWLMNKRLGKW